MTLSVPTTFAPWIRLVPGRDEARRRGATVLFPHAGAAAASYRTLATALAAGGGDTYVVQYPQRADRLRDPAPHTVHDLADGLFGAGPWHRVAPLRLFGHSMGAVVAFEFARIAEARGARVHKLWVSAGPAPCAIAGMPELPTTDHGLLADIADLGGTDPELLADDEFAELLTTAVRADYRAFNRYAPGPGVRIRADIHVLGGRDDHRVDADALRRWHDHTEGAFGLSFYDGGHFYVNDHIDAVAALVNADA
ncbi:thioesterase [Mycobacterium heidelbergense]|uniref:Thioesterase TesA n=1 Tax=Mycobacterium heidelbergense TaxID=53376 RepID=A0A1X0DWR0_MYCHE|nr:thioesterase domain-containing protein [Mycobacterium heidelbergense]MCV7049634.1 thioesterase [Mycobacterium heidelbergense]ORA76659.1 thioesterase [Mycobacterium heidelbergense]BBZ51903.1 thioesterase [Mycobacterium heidelbergense]